VLKTRLFTPDGVVREHLWHIITMATFEKFTCKSFDLVIYMQKKEQPQNSLPPLSLIVSLKSFVQT